MPADPPSPARTWARHEQAACALRRIVELGDALGVDVVPVKGVLTARLLYEDVAERWIQDVDVRVTPHALPSIRARARHEGLREISWSAAFSNLVLDVEGMMVELEAHVGPPGLCGLSVESIVARAVRTTDHFGFPHLEPELHDHALVLVVNAFKDKLVDANAGAIRDLEVVAARPGFDPARFVALARDAGAATLTFIVAEWLAAERASAAWSPIRDALFPPPRPGYARRLARLLRPRSELSHGERLLLRILARDAADGLAARARTAGATGRFLLERARLAPGGNRV